MPAGSVASNVHEEANGWEQGNRVNLPVINVAQKQESNGLCKKYRLDQVSVKRKLALVINVDDSAVLGASV